MPRATAQARKRAAAAATPVDEDLAELARALGRMAARLAFREMPGNAAESRLDQEVSVPAD